MGRRAFVEGKSSAPVLGIDVSRFQGRIDWDRVKAARLRNPVTGKMEPIRFAFIRASGAGYVDASFRDNWTGAKRVGIKRGPYVAVTAAAHGHTASQYVDQLVAALGGDYGATDLEPMIDHERGQNDLPTPEQSRANIAVVLGIRDGIRKRLGRKAGVYSGAYWQQYVPPDVQGALKDAPLWTPDYSPVDAGSWGAHIPDGWTRWHFRQIGSTFRVDGIEGNVDVNLYDGRRATLALHALNSHVALVFAGLASLVVALAFVALYR